MNTNTKIIRMIRMIAKRIQINITGQKLDQKSKQCKSLILDFGEEFRNLRASTVVIGSRLQIQWKFNYKTKLYSGWNLCNSIFKFQPNMNNILVWKIMQIQKRIYYGLKIHSNRNMNNIRFENIWRIRISFIQFSHNYSDISQYGIILDQTGCGKPQNIHIAFLYSCQNWIWGQLVTINVYILFFWGNLTILIKNTFLWDSCQSLACGWYSPLTQVMMGVLWAT